VPEQTKQLRVLVLTAEEGEGHRSVGAALAAELAGEGVEVVVRDVFQDGFSRVVSFFSRDLYRVQLRWLAWSYALEYWLFTRFAPARAVARRGLALLGGRRLARLVGTYDPDVVVSTHPAVTNVLGHLRRRRRRRLQARIVASVSDFGVHRLWAHRGVDLHLVMHEASVTAVERVAGPASARVAQPLVLPAFRNGIPRRDARAHLGLPVDGPVLVVSGGGWGVGDLEGAVGALLRQSEGTVVCVCGHNDRLRLRLEAVFTGEERLRVLGFSEEMAGLLSAADVLVDSTVGVTCLEALACGCPIVAFGSPPGHSRDSARMLDALGLGRLARSPAELAAVVTAILDEGAAVRLDPAPSAASLIVGAQPRLQAPPSRRRALALAAAGSLATFVLAGWAFASTTPYPLVSRALGLRPLSSLPTTRPEVALVVQAPPPLVPALGRQLAVRGTHASFAVDDGRRLPLPHGDELLAVLDSATPLHWLHLRRQLRQHGLKLGRPSFYVVPTGRLSLSAYLLARSAGGRPVVGTIRLSGDTSLTGVRLRPGDIILLRLDPGAQSRRLLVQLIALVSASGLRAVSLSALVASARSEPTARDRARTTPPASTAATEATSAGTALHASPPRTGASPIGTRVSSRNTIGAT
jgi:UDP-N-acetylglucosamine:LPS N-acetylglucosamine transferase